MSKESKNTQPENLNKNIESSNQTEGVEAKVRKEVIENRHPYQGIKNTADASLFEEEGKKENEETNWSFYGLSFNPQVTITSLVIVVLFIGLTLSFPEQANIVFNRLLNGITNYTGWFIILTANVFVLAAGYFAFSRYGSITLGGKNAVPEFSRSAWYAMLLSAGMGIGLLFWSVAEPVLHLGMPSPLFDSITPNTPEAAQAAMATTFFHWGIHPWAIYAIVGLGVAFFSYNKGLPLTIRSLFYPLIGNKIYGIGGHVIDILAVLATLSGLATSLGFGVYQLNAGLNYLFGINISITTQIILIVIITAIAAMSAASGLDSGVKRLSEINMGLAALLMFVILILGPTVFLLSSFPQNVGYYLTNFIEMSTWAEAFKGTNWQGLWTIFYWAWWISWSPFVGTFIARISKGRTVREFITGVVLIPSCISFFFMSVFGGTAIYQQLNGINDIVSVVEIDESLALFSLLEYLPMTKILSLIGMILVTVFFITSADSGALVVDYLTSGGKEDTVVYQRLFWALLSGGLAASLLVGGGLTSIQTASIITGLPFAIVLLIMIYSLYLGLKDEYEIEQTIDQKIEVIKENQLLNEKSNR